MNHLSRALLAIGLFFATGVFTQDFKIEKLGVVERQARIRGHAFSPGTEKYPPRLLIGFVDGDGTWIVNLTTGDARKAEGFGDDYLQWPTFIGADGKLFSSCGKGGLSVYNPVPDRISYHRPIPDARWLRGLAIGPKGNVYVSDYPTGSAARYHPESGKATNFGPQGGPFEIKNIYGYSVGCDGDFVYTASGKMPWFVVAYNVKTGSQENLLEYPPSEHPEIHQRGDRVYLEVKPAGLQFELNDGKATPVDSIPRFDDSYVPGVSDPQPEIQDLDRTLPIMNGTAELRFRPPGQENWSIAKIPVQGNDIPIQRITPLSDGRVLLFTGPYGNLHLFDPAKNTYSFLTNPAGRNVYGMAEIGGEIYFCGYPNGVFGKIDSGKTELIGDWYESIKSKHARQIVEGA
ncbi:MAG: hypothetical protein HKN23_17705, partial [Verrucomicrobiales bacterium]|nr:hypothetical protein [Verrucomicrobiales bacterium]